MAPEPLKVCVRVRLFSAKTRLVKVSLFPVPASLTVKVLALVGLAAPNESVLLVPFIVTVREPA